MTEPLFRGVAEGAGGGAGQEVQGLLGAGHAVEHGAREQPVQHQEFNHLGRLNAAVALPVHLEGAGRAEQGAPLVFVQRRAHVLHRGQQEEVLHVEDARGFVRALEELAQAAEVPGFVAAHGVVQAAGKQRAVQAHFGQEIVRGGQGLRALAHRVVDQQVEAVDVLPHLHRNDLAHRAGVLAGRAQAGYQGVCVVAVAQQESQRAVAVRLAVLLLEPRLVAGDVDQRIPLLGGAGRLVEHEAVVHVDEARHVVGPLHVAAHPVDGIGDPAQHGPAPVAPSASTQVSLLPPPWDELTTSEPLRRATRVRPPGST